MAFASDAQLTINADLSLHTLAVRFANVSD
jgi:hypothetical protein